MDRFYAYIRLNKYLSIDPTFNLLWRAGYTPADRQTSRGVLHHTAQYLYSACI
jgi:hypothetical protein